MAAPLSEELCAKFRENKQQRALNSLTVYGSGVLRVVFLGLRQETRVVGFLFFFSSQGGADWRHVIERFIDPKGEGEGLGAVKV